MKLTKEQLERVEKACERTDYGVVSIKLNKMAKFVDIIVEQQVRCYNEPSNNSNESASDKKY